MHPAGPSWVHELAFVIITKTMTEARNRIQNSSELEVLNDVEDEWREQLSRTLVPLTLEVPYFTRYKRVVDRGPNPLSSHTKLAGRRGEPSTTDHTSSNVYPPPCTEPWSRTMLHHVLQFSKSYRMPQHYAESMEGHEPSQSQSMFRRSKRGREEVGQDERRSTNLDTVAQLYSQSQQQQQQQASSISADTSSSLPRIEPRELFQTPPRSSAHTTPRMVRHLETAPLNGPSHSVDDDVETRPFDYNQFKHVLYAYVNELPDFKSGIVTLHLNGGVMHGVESSTFHRTAGSREVSAEYFFQNGTVRFKIP
eukprot:PhF_6_TR4998/c0_g1_i1/m.7074